MLIDYDRSIAAIALDHARERPNRPAVVFDQGDGPIERLSYAELAAEVRRVAGALVERGLAGRHVALLFAAGTRFVVALLACLAAGSVAAPIAPIGRRRARLENVLALLRAQLPDCLLVDAPMAALFEGALAPALADATIRYVEYDELGAAPPFEPARCEPDRLAVLQFTSGTTSRPKGVMITHGNILANETMIRHAFGHDRDSDFVGWVPHYHDQGLFGNILQPLFLGATSVLTAPSAFVQRPLSWLELISRYRAHTSGGPNFGFDLCVELAARRGVPAIDLSCWRVAFNGAERVQPATLERFARCFAGVGFDPRAFLPCYGLAESTLVTIAARGRAAPLVRTYDGEALSRGVARESAATAAGSVRLACCGPAMAGGVAAIVAEDGDRRLPHGSVGEIWVAGPHVARGYLNAPAETEGTFGAFLDGGEGPFLRTGDLGFATDEGFYVIGRSKDVINLRGRKYAPSDVEHIWATMPAPLRCERAVAAQVEIGERQHVALIGEVKRTDVRLLDDEVVQELARTARALTMERLELGLTDLVLVPEGAIPRTTSGKAQRMRTARMLLAGEIAVLRATGPLAPTLREAARARAPEG